MTFDWILEGGIVIDGSGGEPRIADVGIAGEHVEAIGDLSRGEGKRVPCCGLTVTPGFIDAHVHADAVLFSDRVHEAALRQGITTYVVGQDGTGLTPADPATRAYMIRYFRAVNGDPGERLEGVASMGDYLACFDGLASVNVCALAPNGNLRQQVLGLAERPPSAAELREMRAALRTALEEGAVGLSSGLDYIPSRYADERELADLCREVAEAGRIYVSHMRAQGAEARAGVGELVEVARSAGCRAHISHYFGPGSLPQQLLQEAEDAGADLSFDSYPYLAGSTILGMAALPPWTQAGGVEQTLQRLGDPAARSRLRAEGFAQREEELERVVLAHVPAPEFADTVGLPLTEAARGVGCDVTDFVCDVLVAAELDVGVIMHRDCQTDSELAELACHPAHTAGSDGIFVGQRPHPRGFGAFARSWRWLVTRERRWSPEQAVQHLAVRSAERFSLPDRGRVAPGKVADIAVFDATRFTDRATYAQPRLTAAGMRHVFVNGEPVLRDGDVTGATPGRGLRAGAR